MLLSRNTIHVSTFLSNLSRRTTFVNSNRNIILLNTHRMSRN